MKAKVKVIKVEDIRLMNLDVEEEKPKDQNTRIREIITDGDINVEDGRKRVAKRCWSRDNGCCKKN